MMVAQGWAFGRRNHMRSRPGSAVAPGAMGL